MLCVTNLPLKNLITLTRRLSLNYKNNILLNFRLYNVLNNDIPDISITSIKRVLKNKNTQFEEGHTCFIVNCPICSKTGKNQNINKVYINKTTGIFSCYNCNLNGSWNMLEKFFNSSGNLKYLTKYAFTKNSIKYKSIISNTKQLNKYSEEHILSICNKFSLPIVSSSIFTLLNIRVNESQTCLYVPLIDAIGNVSGFRLFELKQDENGQDFVTERTEPATDCNGLMIGRPVRSRDTSATIVPNLRDALALLSVKVTFPVICLPYGLSSLPLSALPPLERYSKLVLWFGNDINSWDTARAFAKKLNEQRCYLVRSTDTQPLPHIALEQSKDLKSIINSAQPIWHKSIIKFTNLRQDVLSDLQNLDRVQGVKWKRFPTLNKILKGHRRGELTVITGPTGSGKTTFISEYSLDLALQGVATLWGSFEIRNARLARTMLQQMAGCALDENLFRFDEWADQFERLPIYFMTFHGQESIKVVMEAVEHATYVHDIVHVIIDNVQFMMGMSESESRHMDRFWKQDAIIAAFRMFASRRNCHVTLVIHPRKERDEQDLTTSSIFGGAKASQEADNVLIIQDKRLTSVRGKKYLQVAKNRYTGDLGVMPLDFDKSALSYAQKKKKIIGTESNSNDASSLPMHL